MKKRLTNNFGLKIIAVLFAIFLWLMAVNIDNPIDTRDFKNVEVIVQHDEVITNAGQTYQATAESKVVTVSVKARRKILDRITVNDIKAVADMRQLNLKTLVPIKVYISGFEGNYESATTNPENFQISIEASTSRSFPVSVTTVGNLGAGYVLGELTPEPAKITFGGPESIINKIDRVVAKVDVSGLMEDTTLGAELILYDVDNNVLDQKMVTTDPENQAVSVQVGVLSTKSVALKFDESKITAGEGYSYAGLSFEPQSIQVAGTADTLGELNEIAIPAEALSLSGLTEKTEAVVDITPYLPKDIKLVDETANSVAVTVSVVEVGTKMLEVPVKSISIYNLKEGLQVSYGSVQSIDLTFRGSKEDLAGLTLDKIKASIELGTFKSGDEAEVPLKVEITQSGVTADPTSVSVKIQKKQ